MRLWGWRRSAVESRNITSSSLHQPQRDTDTEGLSAADGSLERNTPPSLSARLNGANSLAVKTKRTQRTNKMSSIITRTKNEYEEENTKVVTEMETEKLE